MDTIVKGVQNSMAEKPIQSENGGPGMQNILVGLEASMDTLVVKDGLG